jgi:hypothetical protein
MTVLQYLAAIRNHAIAIRNSDSSFNAWVHGIDIDTS